MFKLVGLGAVLALVFCCCCSMGTYLPESLGQGGPTSWQDLFDNTQAEDSDAQSSAEPSTSGDEGDVGGIPLLGDKLPNITSPVGETEIEVGQIGEIADIPVYPKAEPVSEKVNVPGALSALLGQWQSGMQEEGVAYALYSTSDAPTKVVAWYKTEMVSQGWKTEMALDIGDGSVASFSKSGQDGGALIYTFDDTESGRTTIFVLRGTKD
jgi:hypothetical protein